MAPLPEEQPLEATLPEPQDEDIVISGMSGMFPDCTSVKEFAEKLFNGDNFISHKTRWDFNHPEVSEFAGIVPEADRFDAQFFMVHYMLAHAMDAMTRKLLENSYQAVYDAGLNPADVSNRKLGVFVGNGMSESEKYSQSVIGGLLGCNRAMYSNRISYVLNLKGPSMTIDSGCASSMVALEHAYEALKSGDCEGALVGGCNLYYHPQSFLHYGRMVPINPDGKTKCFSKDADGQSQSEAICVMFLQKYKDAKRVYARVCHARTDFSVVHGEMGQQYGPYRPLSVTTSFLDKFYREAKMSPLDVAFVEAYGAAIPEVDKLELEAIEKIFCHNRKSDLLVGSVMSNMGYSYASTGIVALAKICLSYHRGELAANLHCDSPRDDVKALKDGKMKILTKNQSFDRSSLVAMNNWSISGVNAHALLQGVYKPKDKNRYKSNIPHLVTISGRQEPSVEKILEDLKTRPVDPEEIALLHNIHRLRVMKHMGRGFTILSTNENNETVSLAQKVEYYDESKRPLWFVYSGMGSQWAGMGAQLMRIPVFAATIEKCHKILAPKGIDLIHVLTAQDPKIYDNILHSFVGIAAVQIGLTDVLESMGIVPDKIIGHSVGELGCAYADGCMTAEETILSAYSRGLVSVQTEFIKGSMAAVGLGFKQIKSMLPSEIEVACHNSNESSTISGPAEAVNTFVKSLTEQGVFAKEVACSNIAYHSQYIKEGGPSLLKYLSEVIKSPRERSAKWLSTSIPKEKWDTPIAKFSSAEYHTNNLLKPVLFEETARLIPTNAILVEVAPHGLLQAILKRSLSKNCIHVPLTRRGHPDNAVFLLEAVGNMFVAGVDPNISALYPKVQFPVSTETPGLSHLVSWEHNEKWKLPYYTKVSRAYASAANLAISIIDNENQYLRGHKIDGVHTYPFAGILTSVWNTLAMSTNAALQSLSVVFRDVHLYSLPKLDEHSPLNLCVEIQRGTGKFEVTNEKVTIAKGIIIAATSETQTFKQYVQNETHLNSNDVYRVLYERGYQYSGDFRSIQTLNTTATHAKITWDENWVTFLDGLIQLSILHQDKNKLLQPSHIRQLIIDMKEHAVDVSELVRCKKTYIDAHVYEQEKTVICGGVLIEHLAFTEKPLQNRQSAVLKSLKFIPYFQKDHVDISSALYCYMQIIAENINATKIKALEIMETGKTSSLFSNVQDLLSGLPEFDVDFEAIEKDMISDPSKKIKSPDVVMINNTVINKGMNEALYHLLSNDAFMIILDGTNSSLNTLYRVVASAMTPQGRLVLAKLKVQPMQPALVSIVASSKDLVQLLTTRQRMKPNDRLVILTSYPPLHGLKDLLKKYRKEPQRNKIFLAMAEPEAFQTIQGKQLPDFDLAFNVLSKGIWGGDFYLPVVEKSDKNREIMLQSPRDGDIESLHWVEVAEPVQRSGVRVKVHYAGLNYYDAKKANGEFVFKEDDASEYNYGMDYSGTTESGERVMGIVASGSASTHVQAEPCMLWPVPTHWSLEDAATVPLAFAHAFYILEIKASLWHLYPGMSILVHGATGGLGQAIITIALAHKCRVFATVSDIKKKKFLRKMFPEIPEEHIANSRDGSFVDQIKTATNGAGCALVISCLKGNLTSEAQKCVASLGATIDTHNLHSKENFFMGMYALTGDTAFVSSDFSSIFRTQNKEQMKKIQLMVSEGIAKGYVRPLTRVTYGWNDACKAFRLLAASRHRGRVLLNLQGPMPPAEPRLKLSPSASHVIVSIDKDSMLTLRLVNMLVSRGARTIVLHSQHRPERGDGHLQMRIRSWQAQGICIKVFNESLVSKEQVIEEAKKLGPVEGVLVVSTDSLDEKQEIELSNVLNKLDATTRKLNVNVLYFAVVTGTSNVAQSICQKRSLDGLSASLLKISGLEMFDRPNDKEQLNQGLKTEWSIIPEAIEGALRSSNTITLIHGKDKPQPDLINEVFKIPGIKKQSQNDYTVTLKKMGINNEGCQKLSEVLEQKFATLISRYDIPHLTLDDLRMMNEKLTNVENKETSRLHTFFPRVETDELKINTTLIQLLTSVQGCDLREDEFENEEPHLVLVPGIDGDADKFKSLAQRLKIRAMVFQPGLEHPDESISEMAQRFAKIMLKTLKSQEKFYLLGYSFGALVAMEMATILEKQGKDGVVFCVDAEPDTFPSALETWLKLNEPNNQENFQDDLIEHIYKIITGEDSQELSQKLRRKRQWADKVTEGVKMIRAVAPMTAQYAREVIQAAYGRVQQARKYDPKVLRENILKSQIVLMRTRSKLATGADLSRYSKMPVEIYDLKADHARALDDMSVINIVNSHLGTDILEAYDKMNRCTSYMLSEDFFLLM